MTIAWRENSNGYLEYTKQGSKNVVHVWRGDIDAVGEVCNMFDEESRVDACQRLANNNFGYRNLQRTLTALRRSRDHILAQHSNVDPDDYLDLLTAIEDLEGIVRRIGML